MSLERELGLHLAQSHPSEAALVLERVDDGAADAVLLDLDVVAAHRVLTAMAPRRASAILTRMPQPRRVELVDGAPPMHAAWLLRRLGPEDRAAVLAELQPARSRAMKRALTAREGTAGALVDPDVLALRADMGVADVLDRFGDDLIGAFDSVPVVDEEHQLLGMVRLDDLQKAPRGQKIKAIMKAATSVVRSHLERRGIVAHPGWQDASALPVVDGRGVLLGMLSYRDFRSLERAIRQTSAAQSVPTARALGRLYGLAVGGFFEALVLMSEGGSRQ